MKDILDEIVRDKYLEVESLKKDISASQMRDKAMAVKRTPLNMRCSLSGSSSGIIAEVKRKSPSKGWIKQCADIERVAVEYQQNGASALSVLTDEKYFGGSLDFIRRIRPLVHLPILRKDFIVDEYQLFQAREAGADAVLLIAAALTEQQCDDLTKKAHELSLEVLLEVHSASELSYVRKETDMVGVNNRNLGTFYTDVQNSFDLASKLPQDTLLVSESGISQPEVVKRLRAVGYKGFLIGENFMKTQCPGNALGKFIQLLK
ncbi:MAG: indole-3-glycerol phosphate synthase TrpC [Flavobacteriales bacterium]|nr:indole-3-glycerol phosphate synthase TrpC [Flavobacteriales bacterium]